MRHCADRLAESSSCLLQSCAQIASPMHIGTRNCPAWGHMRRMSACQGVWSFRTCQDASCHMPASFAMMGSLQGSCSMLGVPAYAGHVPYPSKSAASASNAVQLTEDLQCLHSSLDTTGQQPPCTLEGRDSHTPSHAHNTAPGWCQEPSPALLNSHIHFKFRLAHGSSEPHSKRLLTAAVCWQCARNCRCPLLCAMALHPSS